MVLMLELCPFDDHSGSKSVFIKTLRCIGQPNKNMRNFISFSNYLVAKKEKINELECSDRVKKNTLNFIECVENVGGVKLNRVHVNAATGHDELVVELRKNYDYLDVYINSRLIKIETRCDELKRFGVSHLSEAADFVDGYFNEMEEKHKKYYGAIYLEK